ncbi:MAG: tripartite tricarboxylate transporter substrate binding protein [Clostridiales bacterium]|nr:tripartite tricarboxylate transporter substrate binding protein [Clostridiales bacterium]
MKRFLSITLMAILLFSLCACGTSSAPSTAGPSVESSEPVAEWPNGPIELYVPASAGGGTDVIARVVANQLQEDLGVPVSVINQPDGSGVVAFENVRNAKPDGQTLLFYVAGIYSAYESGIYDKNPNENFDGISVILPDEGCGGQAIMVNKNAPYDTFEELVEYCKENPGKVTFTAQSGGYSTFLVGAIEMFCGIQFNKVDGGGQADKITAVLGGYADVMFGSIDGIMPYVESGDAKCLGIMNDTGKRFSAYPDVPNVAEYYPEIMFACDGFFVFGPRGMDEGLKQNINEAVMKAVANDAVKETLAKSNTFYHAIDLLSSVAYLDNMAKNFSNIADTLGY